MNDLDTKLKEILDMFTDKPMRDNKQYQAGQDNIIAQIKQSFIECGWKEPNEQDSDT